MNSYIEKNVSHLFPVLLSHSLSLVVNEPLCPNFLLVFKFAGQNELHPTSLGTHCSFLRTQKMANCNLETGILYKYKGTINLPK